MKKTITILGVELTIRFNIAVQIAYERITDKPFTVKELDKVENTTALLYAAIIANNPDVDITFDQLINELSFDESQLLTSAINDAMNDWYHVAAPAQGEKKEEDTEHTHA